LLSSTKIKFPAFKFHLIFICLPVVFLSCEKEINDDTIIASVGDIEISARDFLISYELSPVKKNPQTVKDKKSAHLSSMIENKLLTIAGLETKLDEQEDVKRLLKWYEKQAVIRELYRQEIRNQVEVSEEEMREAFKLLNEKISLQQFLVSSENQAQKIYQRGLNGETFEDIAMDLADSDEQLNHMLTPSEFTWGELEENLEMAAFGLNENEISAPIKTSSGYHVIQLVDRKENLILTEYDYQNRQHYIETIIRHRKEAKLARAYAIKLMEWLRPKAVGPILLELTNRAKDALRIESSEGKLPPYFQARKIRPHLNELIDENLVIFNGSSWTVGHFIDLVSIAHPKSRPDLTNPGPLQIYLSIMVRDEFLAKQGYQQGLEYSENVQEEINHLRDEILAFRMRGTVLDTIEVSPDEISKFYQENFDDYKTPEMVKVQEIMVHDRGLADSLYREIQNGADFASLSQKFSVRKWSAKIGGDLGFIARDAFGDLGKKAFRLKIGELSSPNPIKLQNKVVGYSILKIVARKEAHVPKLNDIYGKVADHTLKAKRNAVLARFLNNIKEQHPVSVDESVVASIKTTDELSTGRPIDILKVTRL